MSPNSNRRIAAAGAAVLLMAGSLLPGAAAPVSDGHVATHDGLRLYYRTVGSGSNVIVLPAGFLLGDFERLAAPDRTLVFYDQRNRGRSDAVAPDELSIHDEVRDMETLRAHLGASKVTLIGYSYLGLMVVLYAIDHPHRIERIVQLGPVPMRFDTEYPPDLRSDDAEAVMGRERLAELGKLREAGLHEQRPREYCERDWAVSRFMLIVDPTKVAALGDGNCELPNEWPIAFMRAWPHRQKELRALTLTAERLARVDQPVLTIHGRKDRNAAYGAGREWAAMLPNARLLTLDRAAHQSWTDEPDVVFPAVDRFLRGDWPVQAERIAVKAP